MFCFPTRLSVTACINKQIIVDTKKQQKNSIFLFQFEQNIWKINLSVILFSLET